MFRRLFVSVLVAALALVIAPRPSFGLDAGEVRPRVNDHRRCMYRCDERGESSQPSPRRRPLAQNRQPAVNGSQKPGTFTALRHFGPDHWPGCPVRWWRGQGGWGQSGWGQSGWDGDGRPGHQGIHNGRWCPRPIWHPRPRPCWCRPRWHRPRWHDRYDYRDRYRDRDHDGSDGYNHHREHPRGRDF
jgi:hypothetical protein